MMTILLSMHGDLFFFLLVVVLVVLDSSKYHTNQLFLLLVFDFLLVFLVIRIPEQQHKSCLLGSYQLA